MPYDVPISKMPFKREDIENSDDEANLIHATSNTTKSELRNLNFTDARISNITPKVSTRTYAECKGRPNPDELDKLLKLCACSTNPRISIEDEHEKAKVDSEKDDPVKFCACEMFSGTEFDEDTGNIDEQNGDTSKRCICKTLLKTFPSERTQNQKENTYKCADAENELDSSYSTISRTISFEDNSENSNIDKNTVCECSEEENIETEVKTDIVPEYCLNGTCVSCKPCPKDLKVKDFPKEKLESCSTCTNDDKPKSYKPYGTCSGPCIDRYMSDSYAALSKQLDKEFNCPSIKEELTGAVHEFYEEFKKKLIQNECSNCDLLECECESNDLEPYKRQPQRPSRYNFGLSRTSLREQLISAFNPMPEVEFSDSALDFSKSKGQESEDTIDGDYEVEYKEVTRITRTKGEDGKINEHTEVVRSTTVKQVSVDNCSCHNSAETQSLINSETKVTNSSSMATSNVRTCLSTIEPPPPSKKEPEECPVKKLVRVQNKSAKKGLILLPGEMSDKVARETGAKKNEET